MLQNLNFVKQTLLNGGCSCVLSNGNTTLKSRERGVKPILDFIEGGADFKGFAAADKIVGKAAALLYAYMGVGALYAQVITDSALKICIKYGIKTEYDTLTDKIINRVGNGICPMERITENIFNPVEALTAIKKFFLS